MSLNFLSHFLQEVHIDENLNFKDYKLFLFENKYLNAENNIFQIYASSDKRIGWIFPITSIESTDHDFNDNTHYNKYRYVAFNLLLLANNQSIYLDTNLTEFNLSNIYGNDLIALVISNKSVDNFSVNDYIPSLSKFGYFLQNNVKNTLKTKEKEVSIEKIIRKRIILEESKTKISSNPFLTELFNKYLKTIDHHLIRFHLLYQIIELKLSEKFDFDFTDILKVDLLHLNGHRVKVKL